MSDAAHLRHLGQVWAEGGPLQDLRALAEPPPRLKAVARPRLQRRAAEVLIEALIDYVDGQDGDADVEAEIVEPDADLEPGLGWGDPGVQAMAGAGADRED